MKCQFKCTLSANKFSFLYASIMLNSEIVYNIINDESWLINVYYYYSEGA